MNCKDMDADVLAQRILLDLKNTLKKDPLIDEFDVLPVHESHSNTCPVVHIEHKIALEDWCVKHVYVYAYSKFFAWRKKPCKVDSDSLLMWTSAILLINPEIETVWNARKELVCQNLLLPENELKFSELVLSRKPKSSPVYAHRKWVLLEMQKSCSAPCSFQQMIDHELHLCTRFANLYPNNYYAWCHRSWVLKEMCSTDHKTVSDELSLTEKWASVHVSDHCGLHYRQFLLSCLRNKISTTTNKDVVTVQFNDSSSINEALRRELDFLGGLQTMYPGHEALWYHRRYILHEINMTENVGDSMNTVEFKIRSSSYEKTGCIKNGLDSNSTEIKVHSAYGNTGCSNDNLHGNSTEFKVHSSSYGNTEWSNDLQGDSTDSKVHCHFENLEVAATEGCKRHKLESAVQELSNQGKVMTDDGLLKGTVHCKRHKVEFRVSQGWGATEEDAFLKQRVLLSREGVPTAVCWRPTSRVS